MLYQAMNTIKAMARFSYYVFLKACFIFLEIVLPKNKNYWCFCTWQSYPHTLDNPRAVFEVVKSDPEICKIILRKDNSGLNHSDGLNVKFVDAESIRGVYFTARSRVILLGYSLGGLSSYSNLITRRHCIIQLWHGIPLKKIGMLFPEEKFWPRETGKYSATVCSSSQDKEFMTRAFSPIPEDRVWQTGLPRNDTILKDERLLPDDYLAALREYRARIDGRKLVLYAPTWRIDSSNIYVFSDKELAQLDEVLESNNAVFAVRGHSNVRSHQLMDGESGSFRIIDANAIADVNILLRLADVLITDYSSIYIDYLITGRPILHFTYDLESYYKERGFLYDIDTAFASKEFLRFEDLIEKLDKALKGEGVDKEQYRRARELFHDHGDQSSAIVVGEIKRICFTDG